MSFDSSRYQLPSSNSIAGIERLAGALDHRGAVLPARPRAFHDLVLDPLLIERLLHLPAGMSAGLGPDVGATVELDAIPASNRSLSRSSHAALRSFSAGA